MKSGSRDMTVGSPLRLLTAFTLPALAGNLLNQVYSITDSIIVGRYLGQTSLAAIGVTMPIVLLTAAMVIGLNVGVGILLSQAFGRKDIGQMRHTFANSLYLALIIAVFTTGVGLPLTLPILKLMGTPSAPMAEAASYMHINFATTIFPLLYYLFNNAFRGMGDSMMALWCLIVSVVINVFLDILFVAVFGWGVPGTAWATAIAQALSVVFSAVMLYRRFPEMRLRRADFRPDRPLLGEITKLAVPIAVQTGFNNLGNVVVQSCINGFGEAVMAAYTAASRLGTLSLMPAETLGSSMSVFAGQNFGAGRLGRIKKGVKASWQLNVIISVILGGVLLVFGKSFIGLFLKDPSREVTTAAYRFLLFAAVPGILNGIMCIYQQTLRGVGKATQAVIGGFMQLGAKVLVALLGARVILQLDVVWLAWPVSFVAGTVFPFLVYRRMIRGVPEDEPEQNENTEAKA